MNASFRAPTSYRSGLRTLLVVGLVVVACKPLPPPPVVAFHGDTEAGVRGTVTAMLIVGAAGQILGGGGAGVALRLEHQQTDRTTLGIELTGGSGSEDDSERVWLGAVRGYGRTQLPTRFVAATYGLGLSVMDVGLVTLSAHGGAMTSYPNDYLAPFFGAGFATAIPLRRGRPWGKAAEDHDFCFHCAEPPKRSPLRTSSAAPVRADVFLYLDVGAATRFGGTDNQLSFDIAGMIPWRADEGVVAFSMADAQRFVP